jgi:hypothetical protein
MVDTSGRCQVDFTDPMCAEEDAMISVGSTRADGCDRPRPVVEEPVGLLWEADIHPNAPAHPEVIQAVQE